MDGGWIEKKMDGWMDGQKKYMKKIWMVGWIKKLMDGGKQLMDGGWIEKNEKNRWWMDGWR